MMRSQSVISTFWLVEKSKEKAEELRTLAVLSPARSPAELGK